MESNKDGDKLIFLARTLAERGVFALRFDFSYCGESSGSFADLTCSGEVDDLRAAFDFASQSHGKIAIFGSSMGGTVALLFAAQKASVAGLVTFAAPVHPEDFPRRLLSDAEIKLWHQQGFAMYHGQRLNLTLLEDLEQIDVPSAARRIDCPVLILHGDCDEVVPIQEARELYSCLSGKKQLSILPGADHRMSNPEFMERAMSETLTWLLDSVG
jgi:pimeloyl-ACP methyl ester carboxylesterase